MDDRSQSDERLLRRYLAGDEQGACIFYQRYAKSVARHVSFLGLSSLDSTEIVQQTFIAFFLDLKRDDRKFELQRTALPWLQTIAKRKAIDLIRQRKNREASFRVCGIAEESAVDNSSPQPLESLLRHEDRRDQRVRLCRVDRYLATLPREDRELVQERFQDPDFSFKAFCERKGIEPTVSNQRSFRRKLHRVLTELREYFAKSKIE